MNITFHGTLLSEVIADMRSFISDVESADDVTLAAQDEPAPKTRTRRSKKDATTADPEPKTRTRRSKKTEEASDTTAEDKPKRTRTRKAKAPEFPTDADLTRAAGILAAAEDPEAVTFVLMEFGVSTVGDIPDTERQEFIDMCLAPTETDD